MEQKVRKIIKKTVLGIIKEQEKRVNFNIDLPEDIEKINDIFKANGYSLFLVGGAVRDALLGKTPKDFDISTDAVPDEVERMLNGTYKTLPTGKAFGVINVFTPTGDFEIATFRKDIGAGRRPDSVEFTTIDQDVSRRDLTINALFYDIENKQVVDLVGGIEDLKNGVVRTVGNAVDRFGEDKLRKLRAIRFAARFGSDLDQDAAQALSIDNSLEGVSAERIRDEFLKGIKSSKDTIYFLNLIDSYKMFDWIFPGLNINRSFVGSKDIPVVLSEILKNNNIDTLKRELNTLTYSRDEITQISFLLSCLELSLDTAVLLKRAQKNSKLSDAQIKEFANLNKMDSKLVDAFLHFKLTINGDEVMRDGFVGSELGKEINRRETENFKKLIS